MHALESVVREGKPLQMGFEWLCYQSSYVRHRLKWHILCPSAYTRSHKQAFMQIYHHTLHVQYMDLIFKEPTLKFIQIYLLTLY